MSDTKSYIFQFNENNQQFTLTGVDGEEMIIDSNHKKYDWLHNLDPNKIVKINASGRWNSSKDYQGIREMILSQSNTPSTKDQAEPPSPSHSSKKRKKTKKSPPASTDASEGMNQEDEPSQKTQEPQQSSSKSKPNTTNKKAEASHHEPANDRPPVQHSMLGIHTVELDIELTNMIHVQQNDFNDAEEAKVLIKSYSDLKSKLSLEEFSAGLDKETYDELLLETAIAIIQTKSKTFSVNDIQTNMKVGYNRATRIYNQLANLSIIQAGFSTDIDPKDNAWPLLEKVTCSTCQGEGQTYHTEKQKTGFLKLRTKDVQVGTSCTQCNGKGFTPKVHYPYTLTTKDKELSIELQVDLDPIVKIILDTYISETDFTDQAVIKLIQQCNPFKRMCEKHIQDHYDYEDGYHTDIDFPMQATWKKIQELGDELKKYLMIYVYSKNIKPIIKLLFKLDILDISTKRRSTKDENTYYKLTKNAKKIYSQLDESLTN